MKTVTMTEAQSNLPMFLKMAEGEEVVITESGKPVGLLLGLDADDDWDDLLLESDPRFLKRIAKARDSYRRGDFVRLEDLDEALSPGP